MGSGVTIHCEPRIAWQTKRAAYFAEGFKAAGIRVEITADRFRHDGFPVLLGTTLWRGIEASGEYLLVDRCSFGDTEQFVSLVFNGHGRRGDHRLPEVIKPDRWEKYGTQIQPWKRGHRVILCGQTETYSPHWMHLGDWYSTVEATHFRKHPAGINPTRLPEVGTFDDCRACVTLNSSVAVQAVLEGIPTVTMDEGSMAWDVTGHSLDDIRQPNRELWAWSLAYTQWHDDEIREGKLWDSLL